MKTIIIASTFFATNLLTACLAKAPAQYPGGRSGASKVASVTMPIPPAMKPFVAEDKINAYSLVITGGACLDGATGTTINKPFAKLSPDDKLANEKIRKACDYTVILSLGKADAAGTKMEKIYLTNDIEGKRTFVTKDKTQSDKIPMDVIVWATDLGKQELGIGQPIIVPSITEVDANINVSISNSNQPSSFDWRKEIVLSDVPTFTFTGDHHGSAYYLDIMQHTPKEELFTGQGASTEAHETLHGLVNSMRNKTSDDDGFFYFENGKGAYVLQPKKVSSKVKDYVGTNFKTEAQLNYKTYLVDQPAQWPDVLYLFDEWNGYVATARTAVEMQNAGKWDNQNADPLMGLSDFLYFGCAAVTALKDHDPEYLQQNKQFKAMFAMMAEMSIQWIDAGQKTTKWPTSAGPKRLQMLRTDAENEKIRATIKEFMGVDWTQKILGF